MDEFANELKEFAAGLHDGMGGHADYCARLMEEAADRINRMKSDYTAQGLALKAAKAMQQAETARADANEQDAKRYATLRNANMDYRNRLEHYSGSALDVVIDKLMSVDKK